MSNVRLRRAARTWEALPTGRRRRGCRCGRRRFGSACGSLFQDARPPVDIACGWICSSFPLRRRGQAGCPRDLLVDLPVRRSISSARPSRSLARCRVASGVSRITFPRCQSWTLSGVPSTVGRSLQSASCSIAQEIEAPNTTPKRKSRTGSMLRAPSSHCMLKASVCCTANSDIDQGIGRCGPRHQAWRLTGSDSEIEHGARGHFHVASPARAGTAMAMASICRFSHPEAGVGFSGSPSAAAAGRSDSAASRSSRARKRASRPSPTASSPVPAATHWPAGAAPRACPRSPTLPSACGMTSGPAGAIRGTPTTGRRAWRAMVPRIGRMAVCDVASADVLAILTPIWHIDDAVERQRGWRKNPGSQQPRRFHWPAWRQPLDSAGIDALLDAWNPEPEARATWPRVGVHAAWRSVRFEPRGSTDKTRAFGAQRL